MRISKLYLVSFVFYTLYLLLATSLYYGASFNDIEFDTNDAYNYYLKSTVLLIDLRHYGLKYVLSDYYRYSGSLHFMHYYILAFIRLLFNNSYLIWIIFQITVYSIGCIFFAKIMTKFGFSKKYEVISITFLMINLPLIHYVFSVMRDIEVFTVTVLCIFLYKKKLFVYLAFMLLLLTTYRINAAISVVIFVLADYILSLSRERKIKLKLSYFVYGFVFIALITVIDNLTRGAIISISIKKIAQINIIDLLLNTFKFILSPLPWSIDPKLPVYLHAWYSISFFVIFLVIGLTLITRRLPKYDFVIPILLMLFVNIIVYSTEIEIGFRQTAVLIPWIVVPCVLHILNYTKLNRN